MSEVRVSWPRLAYELGRRGLDGTALCRPTGISRSTLSRIRQGVAISGPTALRIGRVLADHEVRPELDAVLVAPEPPV